MLSAITYVESCSLLLATKATCMELIIESRGDLSEPTHSGVLMQPALCDGDWSININDPEATEYHPSLKNSDNNLQQ